MWSRLKKFSQSINARIVVPIILVTLVQSIVVTALLYFSVIRNTINNSLVNSFENNVNIRKNYLETLISNQWKNLDIFYEDLYSTTSSYMSTNGVKVDDILNDDATSKDYLYTISSLLPELIKDNKVNDAYIVLNNDQDDKNLIYLRNKNPNQTSNSEIDVLYAPYNVWKDYFTDGYSIDPNVDTNKFSDIKNNEFYNNAIKYGKVEGSKTTGITIQGYWSPLTNVSKTKVLSYSVPLYINDKCLGVFGIGITETYLKTCIGKLNGNNQQISFAFIRKTNDKYEYGFDSYVDKSLPSLKEVTFNKSNYSDLKEFTHNDETIFCYEEEIDIYDGNNETGDSWYLIGLISKNYLFDISLTTSNEIIIIYGISFLLIVIIYFLIAYLISKPIVKVSNNLNELNVLNLPKTNILEVDNLLEQINNYSSKTNSLNNRLNRLIQDSNFKISFFEYFKKEDKVNVTKQFFDMLGLPYDEEELNGYTFIYKIRKLNTKIISSTYKTIDESILKTSGEITFFINSTYYMQLKIIAQEDGVMATLTDLTKEYVEKERIVHERDYDVLTGLLNRRGFISKVTPLFEQYDNASLFMIDVDNLKFINDQYGHDLGDAYLKKVGEVLNRIEAIYDNVISCHVSGDEFIIYLYGYTDLSKEKEIVNQIEKIKEEYVVSRTKKIYISLSVGVCRKSENITYDELYKHADYAMYIAKNDGKNQIRIFDDEILKKYQNENVMYEDLNRIITYQLIDYAYQPIVDINTGEILGYEALMRPTLQGFNPTNVLNAAKKFNRLYDIEKLTLFNASEKFINSHCTKKLFINSISSQVLSDVDLEEFTKKYKEYFNQFVIELIEEDFGQSDVIKKKIDFLDKFNIKYAIDDYGTGYNNIGMILSFSPSLVKIEGSLIRNIDKDKNKQRLAKSIISYCSVNKIKIVAESVETIEELKLVKQLGVDYIQGYFLAKPDLEIKDIPEEKKEILRKL